MVECLDEDQVVDERGDQRERGRAGQEEGELGGFFERVEARRCSNGAGDALFHDRYARLERHDPHLKIEFRPVRVELQNPRSENSGNAAQPGWRIVCVRDDQTFGMREHAFGDALDIVRVTIGMGGDRTDQVGEGAEGVIEAGPDRGAPAQIRRVAEDYDARQFRGASEEITKIGAAAIVHYDDVGQGLGCEGADEIQQTVGRPMRGNEYRDAIGVGEKHPIGKFN